MATPPNGLDITQQSQTQIPQAPQSQEHTSSAPMVGTADEPQNSAGLSKDDQTKLIALVRRYKDQWSQDRLILMQRCLENLEYFKGNQFISFGGGNAQFFDALDWIGNASGGNQHSQDSDDKDLYQYCNNFYQMLATGFVAALAPQLPKSVWMPDDADQLTDVTTAKTAQTLIDIIERRNREQSLLKQQLLYLYTTGAVFRWTRFVVSEDRWGTKPQPVFDTTETTIMPDRMHCFNCGTDNPAQTSQCVKCGNGMGADSFFPAVVGPVTKQVGTQDVPNGMVAQNLYCPLEIDCDPKADNLRQTPILNFEVEVHLGALRAAYPDMYAEIQASATSELSSNGSIDRIARQQVFSQTTAYTSILSDQKPTLSRTWIQPWAFDLEDDQEFGKRMRETYPSGLLLINTGSTFLSAREAELAKEWTWAGTHEGFGLYPPSIGDIVVPFQKKYNDIANICHEWFDRCASGITLANVDLIDTKAMQGKPMLPAILNPVKLKRSGAPGTMKLADSLYQFQFEFHAEILQYAKDLVVNAQTWAGVPPQVYGGEGDEHIETFGGQQQQLNTALGKLNIYWENLKDEHAQADEIAVECAKDNLTEDMRQVIREKGSEFRNDYIRLDDLQGSIHAYSDEDQGLPVTAAELRQRWMDLLNAAEKNDVIREVFLDPSNQEQCAQSLGVPDMVVPGEAMRSKTLQIIEKLLKSQAIPQTDPNTGMPTGQVQPSIMPDKDIDDFTVLKATVRQYCQENFDMPNENPNGWQNLLAYFTAAVAMETQQLSDVEVQKGKAALAGHLASQSPPPPPPQLTPGEQDLMTQLRKDAVPVLDDLVKIAGAPVTQQGQSYQGQVAAGSKVLDFVAKAEQLAADKTAPQGQ